MAKKKELELAAALAKMEEERRKQEELEQLIDQMIEEQFGGGNEGGGQQEPAQAQQSQAQQQPAPPPPPPPPPRRGGRGDDQAIRAMAEILAERKGVPVEHILPIIKELFDTDKELLDVMERFNYIKSGLASGEASSRVADLTGARLLSRLGRRLEERITRRGAVDMSEILELYKMRFLEKILSEEEQRGGREERRYVKVPLVNMATGEIVTGPDGAPVFIEVPAEQAHVYTAALLSARRPREEDGLARVLREMLEEMRREREELRRALEEVKEDRYRSLIEDLREELKSLREALRSAQAGGGGGQAQAPSRPSLRDLVEEVNETVRVLERLGFRVSRGEEERREKPSLGEKIADQLLPALADVIKNPEKLKTILEAMASMARIAAAGAGALERVAEAAGGPGGSEEPPLAPPELESYLEGGGGGGAREGGGGPKVAKRPVEVVGLGPSGEEGGAAGEAGEAQGGG